MASPTAFSLAVKAEGAVCEVGETVAHQASWTDFFVNSLASRGCLTEKAAIDFSQPPSAALAVSPQCLGAAAAEWWQELGDGMPTVLGQEALGILGITASVPQRSQATV